MKTKTGFFLTLTAACMALAHPLAATTEQDWPIWSGPHGNLTASGDGVFERPGFGLELLWSRPLGSGYSAISVVGERLVTAFSDGDSDFLVVLDATSGEAEFVELIENHEMRNLVVYLEWSLNDFRW